MATLTAINTLTELVTRQSEDAAIRLGHANKAKEEANQKLSLLEDYRATYAEQLQNRMARGLTVNDFANFQKFLASLDLAITQQKQVLQNTDQLVEKQRNEWQQHERKRLSFNTLSKRAEIKLQKQENKREQKQTDEHAARIKMVKL
jgi:flagellar FliJ protein